MRLKKKKKIVLLFLITSVEIPKYLYILYTRRTRIERGGPYGIFGQPRRIENRSHSITVFRLHCNSRILRPTGWCFDNIFGRLFAVTGPEKNNDDIFLGLTGKNL